MVGPIKQLVDSITAVAEQIEQDAGDIGEPSVTACQAVIHLSTAQTALNNAKDLVRLAVMHERDLTTIAD